MAWGLLDLSVIKEKENKAAQDSVVLLPLAPLTRPSIDRPLAQRPRMERVNRLLSC